MAAHRVAERQNAQKKHVQTHIKASEVAKVYKALKIDSEATRRQYIEWYEEGRPEPKTSFEVIERGDTRSFD